MNVNDIKTRQIPYNKNRDWDRDREMLGGKWD